MTRDEFFEEITTWWQLRNFCEDNGYEQLFENIFDEESRDEWIEECLIDWVRDYTWQEVFERLERIPTGYDYYRYDDNGDWGCLDNEDLSDLMEEVAEWCDTNDIWDAEDDEETQEEDDDEENTDESVDDETPIEDEDFSLDELFLVGIGCIQDIEETERARAAEAEKEFDMLYHAV